MKSLHLFTQSEIFTLLVLSVLLMVQPCISQASEEPASLASSARSSSTLDSMGPLSADKMRLVHQISRQVLAAKKSGIDGDVQEDKQQLANLRTQLDELIAVEVAQENTITISVQGRDSGDARNLRDRLNNLRTSARSNARAIAAQLRSYGEQRIARARTNGTDVSKSNGITDKGGYSAGMPVAEQRGRLFERWSRKLDAALAEGGDNRLNELRALRYQLSPSVGSLSDAPLAHGTPTMQAMPAGYVPPKNTGFTAAQ